MSNVQTTAAELETILMDMDDPEAKRIREERYTKWLKNIGESKKLVRESFESAGLDIEDSLQELLAGIVEHRELDRQDVDDIAALITLAITTQKKKKAPSPI